MVVAWLVMSKNGVVPESLLGISKIICSQMKTDACVGEVRVRFGSVAGVR